MSSIRNIEKLVGNVKHTMNLPDIAYCTATLYYDNIHCVKRGNKGYKVHIKKGDGKASFTLTKKQMIQLGLDHVRFNAGVQGYLTMPAFLIAEVANKLKISEADAQW